MDLAKAQQLFLAFIPAMTSVMEGHAMTSAMEGPAMTFLQRTVSLIATTCCHFLRKDYNIGHER